MLIILAPKHHIKTLSTPTMVGVGKEMVGRW